MRYYHPEHESAYREVERRGHTQWNDLFDPTANWTYDHFQNRPFLEQALPHLALPGEALAAPAPRAFEYGCGTGPAACWLAAQGFEVDAIDLIPEAITIARRMAEDRGLRVTFAVADICDLPTEPHDTPVGRDVPAPPQPGAPSPRADLRPSALSPNAIGTERKYDLVLDSYCLQSIVTDEDRRAVFAAVRARLKPSGYYVISTAVRGPERTTEPGFHYDESTGIYYREIPPGSVCDQVVELGGRWYAPHRRHLSADALRNELTAEGFQVLTLEGSDAADVVCRPTGSHPLDGTPEKAETQ
ncbi:methyltransferase domain-containing protein [Kribbella italica]|uniref:SAM-dependent methyltransferase n=1 Tax=Kribbella italica TaxID=1540520 RepID=A0A7W9MWR1_9ACTN|nr:SAM-dependent methyltransferase [Kribbella italica]